MRMARHPSSRADRIRSATTTARGDDGTRRLSPCLQSIVGAVQRWPMPSECYCSHDCAHDYLSRFSQASVAVLSVIASGDMIWPRPRTLPSLRTKPRWAHALLRVIVALFGADNVGYALRSPGRNSCFTGTWDWHLGGLRSGPRRCGCRVGGDGRSIRVLPTVSVDSLAVGHDRLGRKGGGIPGGDGIIGSYGERSGTVDDL